MNIEIKEIIKYINLVREYPQYYVALLDQQISEFIDQMTLKLSPQVIYQTIEGVGVWVEARKYLLQQKPIRPFQPHKGLQLAATDHVKDIVEGKTNGHRGSDGSTFHDRVQRYCRKGRGSMIELLGSVHQIEKRNILQSAVLNFIIDDGVSSRGHRLALFNQNYKYLGVNCIQKQQKLHIVIALSQINLECISNVSNITATIATSTTNLLSEKILPILENSPLNDSVQLSKTRLLSRKNMNEIPSSEQEIRQNFNQKSRFYQNPTNQVNQNNESRQKVWTLVNMQEIKNPKNLTKMNKNKIMMQPSIKNIQQNGFEQVQNKNKNFKSNFFRQDTKQNFNQKLQESSKESKKQSNFKKSKNSMFSDSNSFLSKKIVEKRQKTRTFEQNEYIVKQKTTIIKYDDGTTEDVTQKVSLLKNKQNGISQNIYT